MTPKPPHLSAPGALRPLRRKLEHLNKPLDSSKLDAHVLGTYFYLRRLMSWLAILLPLMLVLGGEIGLFWTGHLESQNSLSAYYHANSANICSHQIGMYRDLFVGFLSAISVCLIAYKGYTVLEDNLCSAAGVLLAGVAFFPMAWPEAGKTSLCKTSFIESKLPLVDISTHFACAVLFFFVLLLIIGLTSGNTLRQAEEEASLPVEVLRREKVYWEKRYNWLTGLMASNFGLLIFGVAWQENPLGLDWFSQNRWHNFLLIGEALGIWIFAAYWLLKTCEIESFRRKSKLLMK